MFYKLNFDNESDDDGVVGEEKEKVQFQVTASVFTLLAIALERHRAVITPLAPRCFFSQSILRCFFYSICFKTFLFTKIYEYLKD